MVYRPLAVRSWLIQNTEGEINNVTPLPWSPNHYTRTFRKKQVCLSSCRFFSYCVKLTFIKQKRKTLSLTANRKKNKKKRPKCFICWETSCSDATCCLLKVIHAFITLVVNIMMFFAIQTGKHTDGLGVFKKKPGSVPGGRAG